MKVIFLDIDGVLNSDRFFEMSGGAGLAFGQGQIDPDCVERLNAIIDATGARVVISSSWRHVWSKEEIGRLLDRRGFRHRDAIIGLTPSLMTDRGSEVSQWLNLGDERRRIDPSHDHVDSYVILDDSDEFESSEMRERFVQIDPLVGLTDQDASRAIEILGT